MKDKLPQGNKGFVLVLALVTMLAMTVIGLSVVMNMTTDMQLSRNERDAKIAFQLAEAGINEAIARLHQPTSSARYIGELSADANYRTITWNSDGAKDFGAGNADSNRVSADSLNYEVSISYLDESNPEGFCDENNPGAGPNTSANHPNVPPLSCDQTGPELVMFGKDFRMGSLTYLQYGKLPIYSVTSTGTSNGTSRTIVAYVSASSLNLDTEAGIKTNDAITWNGGDCASSVIPSGSCITGATDDYNTYLGEQLAKIKNMADEIHRCSNPTCSGAGDDIPANGGLDDVVQDWGDISADTYSSFIYIDNAGGNDVKMTNLSGRGILVVTGDLDLAGNLHYEGLIYVLGELTLSGGGSAEKQVTGGIMAQSVVTLNGSNLTVNYSQATLEEVAKENSTSNMILWKRL